MTHRRTHLFIFFVFVVFFCFPLIFPWSSAFSAPTILPHLIDLLHHLPNHLRLISLHPDLSIDHLSHRIIQPLGHPRHFTLVLFLSRLERSIMFGQGLSTFLRPPSFQRALRIMPCIAVDQLPGHRG